MTGIDKGQICVLNLICRSNISPLKVAPITTKVHRKIFFTPAAQDIEATIACNK